MQFFGFIKNLKLSLACNVNFKVWYRKGTNTIKVTKMPFLEPLELD